MRTGEAWIYPLRLQKGIQYSISTSGSGAVMNLRSSLFKDHKGLICESGKDRKTFVSLVPEENGVHKLTVALWVRRVKVRTMVSCQQK
jgi:hypothetical protein